MKKLFLVSLVVLMFAFPLFGFSGCNKSGPLGQSHESLPLMKGWIVGGEKPVPLEWNEVEFATGFATITLKPEENLSFDYIEAGYKVESKDQGGGLTKYWLEKSQ